MLYSLSKSARTVRRLGLGVFLRLDDFRHDIKLATVQRYLKESSIVVVFCAVVGRRKNRDQMTAGKILISILHALVRANHQLQAGRFAKILHPIRAILADLISCMGTTANNKKSGQLDQREN